MRDNNHFINTVAMVLAALTLTLTACGGSGSKSTPVVAPPVVAPPVVVVPAGLTLEEVVSKFNGGGALNLTKDVSGNVSFGSGSDLVESSYSFSADNSNGSKVCVSYMGQDDVSNFARDFKFSSMDCDKELLVGGKADFDSVMSNFNGYSAGAFVSAPALSSYDIYNGSEDVSFKLNNGDISVCTDSVTGSSDYVIANQDVNGDVSIDVLPGIYTDETFAGEKFSVSCDTIDSNGNSTSFSDVASYDASFGSIPEGRLARIIRDSFNGTDALGTESPYAYNNSLGTRACVEFVDGDTITSNVQTVSSDGCDLEVLVGKTSEFYTNGSSSRLDELGNEIVGRYGTPVLKQAKNYLANNFYQNSEAPTFQVKNVDLSDSICELNSTHDRLNGLEFNISADSDLTDFGFNKYLVGQFQEDFNNELNPLYLDSEGNYNLGNLNCTFYSPNLGENVIINNVLSISGNINDNP